jgi:hypothetical protein
VLYLTKSSLVAIALFIIGLSNVKANSNFFGLKITDKLEIEEN